MKIIKEGSIVKKVLTVVLALMLMLSLAACGNTSTPSQKESSTPEKEAKKVSILTPYLSSVTTNQMVESLKSGLESKGITVTVVDTKGDFAQLASRIEDVVSTKADAMVLVSTDPNQVKTQLQAAFDANIPVFGCDSGYIDGMMVNATSDNYTMEKPWLNTYLKILWVKKVLLLHLLTDHIPV